MIIVTTLLLVLGVCYAQTVSCCAGTYCGACGKKRGVVEQEEKDHVLSSRACTNTCGGGGCAPCDPGTYESVSTTACLLACSGTCPSGYTCPAGSTSSSACAMCPVGYFSDSSSGFQTVCSACRLGTYAPSPASSSCTTAAPGYFTDATTGQTSRIPCLAGTYCPGGTWYSLPCHNGQYSTTGGAIFFFFFLLRWSVLRF
jgi:hypothetical protein